ncbi:MAG: DUF2867 domain-containing protein [Acidobacteria bacterium]|nr:DUF2867 domain-containing protein [Acidobacteriota bacterium]
MKNAIYQKKLFRVHQFLSDVPIRTLERIDLPGGKLGLTIQELGNIVGFGGEEEVNIGPVTKALFDLRGLIGRIFHWDEVPDLIKQHTYLPHLSPEDRRRSVVEPGKPAGISRILYQFENEMLGEIINRTVHCFWVLAMERAATGYVLWVAVYVKKINWFTPIYMALITPMLKWIIYPAMFRSIKRRWEQHFPSQTGMRYLPKHRHP